MNLFTFYKNAINTLSKVGCDSPEFDVRELFDYCLKINKTQLLLRANESIDNLDLSFFNECLEKRRSRVPLQYILGEWDFYKYRFKVGEGVLIPRPETELIPEFIFDACKENSPKVIYDICTGSGCIGISVAKMFPSSKVFCIDISEKALFYAKENREKLCADNVTIINADALTDTAASNLPAADIIISNPPYIKNSELEELQKEVHFEPQNALDGGEDGLVFYRALNDIWLKKLNENGFMILECGENQAKDILEIFYDNIKKCRLLKDAQKIDRVVVLKK